MTYVLTATFGDQRHKAVLAIENFIQGVSWSGTIVEFHFPQDQSPVKPTLEISGTTDRVPPLLVERFYDAPSGQVVVSLKLTSGQTPYPVEANLTVDKGVTTFSGRVSTNIDISLLVNF